MRLAEGAMAKTAVLSRPQPTDISRGDDPRIPRCEALRASRSVRSHSADSRSRAFVAVLCVRGRWGYACAAAGAGVSVRPTSGDR